MAGTTIDGLNSVTSLTSQDEVPVWDAEASGEPTKKITAQNMAASVKTLGSLVNTTEMNNALAGKQNTLTFDTTPTAGSTNPVTSGGIANAIQQSTALTTGTVTWDTQNVEGDHTRCNWFQIGMIVIASLEFTPISGRIVNGYGICSNLPAPRGGNNVFVYSENDQQMAINANGYLLWYFPSDTTTTRRIDITIVYVATS